MNGFSKRKLSFRLKKPGYIQAYHGIRKRCRFQKRFSGLLLTAFFALQYSVPISLVVLGSVSTSREQLTMFFYPGSEDTSDPKQAIESKVSRIIYIIGLLTILLGVINNIVRPAESYDTAAKYNNKFYHFEQNLKLEFLMGLTSHGESSDNKDSVRAIVQLLIQKNHELSQLIEEFNEARSLSPRQAHLQALNQGNSKDNLSASESVSSVGLDNSQTLSPDYPMISSKAANESEVKQADKTRASDRT